MTTRTETRRAFGWVTFLLGTIVLLRVAATGTLDAPPLTSVGALADWGDARGPATSAMALVRFVGELVAWYLLGLTVLYGVASTLRSGGITALADALAVPGARGLVRGGLGLGLLASTAAGATNTDDHAPPAPTTAVMQPLLSGTADRGTAWMTPHPTVAEPAPAPAPQPDRPAPPSPTTWTVAEGESFWSIAHDVLVDVTGREPADTEIDPYWRSLVDANRARLVDSGDPDTIHPGQVFELPPT